MKYSDKKIHPGTHIKAKVIPPGVTVTRAAELLGVSRPALSNLLNGKAALSPDMAARLEKVFGNSRDELLKLQADFDASEASAIEVPNVTTRYVVPFLGVTSTQIEEWATKNISARSRLPVLIRTLVHSTTNGLLKVDFPGDDDSQRPGWDGWVEASTAAPWVPNGQSGWEFGVTANIKSKADDDFEKSVKAANKEERLKTTFVFVTPRKWSGKKEWVKAAKAKKEWADIVALDASDLGQWMEQSIAAQVWFANETERPSDGVRTLDTCWSNWADVADPPLSDQLFLPAINDTKQSLNLRFSKDPDGPTLITADSTDEALAFVSQVFSAKGGETLEKLRDRVLVFDKPGILPKLLQGAHDFIIVTHYRAVEREIASIARNQHCIVVYPRNQINDDDTHVILKPIDYESFRKSLEAMGKTSDDVSRLSAESGHSLTVLRRRLAKVPAVKQPEWSSNPQVANKLIPFAFVGAWNSTNETDQIGITLVASAATYEQVEKDIVELLQLNDAPAWSVGKFRGVVSKTDAIFGSAQHITRNYLDRFFSLARMVLGEDDPSLDLPESERWAAAMHGKTRDFSGAFRKGVAETFVFLAVHGKSLFKQRLGYDVEFEASRIVRELIGDPIDMRKLEASDRDLPLYAEAAPETFLSLIENDLSSPDTKVMKLIRPAAPDHFGGRISRTGLLWALEGLCWNPQILLRTTLILAQLSEVEINDNWNNKPINSLISTFRAWMPQTAADLPTRIAVVKQICTKFPKIGWQLCISQFSSNHEIGHYSHKPKWRSDGYGFGEPLKTWPPIDEFRIAMVELVLAWPAFTTLMICDLIARLQDLDTKYQETVWQRVKIWADDQISETDRAEVREKIRTTVLSRRAARRLAKSTTVAVLTKTAKETYELLEPKDVVQKYSWLFKKTWIEDSADDFYNDTAPSYEKREEWITAKRLDALTEVFEVKGFDGVMELAAIGEASWQAGWLVTKSVLSDVERPAFLSKAIEPLLGNDASFAQKNVCRAFLAALPSDIERANIIKIACNELTDEEKVEVLKLAPFGRWTWDVVDALRIEAQKKYWSEVNAEWIRDSNEVAKVAVQRLLAAKRPRAAFACVSLNPEDLEVGLLFELMSALAGGGDDQPGHYQLEGYNVKNAMKLISGSSDLTLEEKAMLEFRFLEVLSKAWGDGDQDSISNLEKYIEGHPEMYVQAVVWAFKRKDDGSDPTEYQTPTEYARQMADRGYKLLHSLSRTPGHDKDGNLLRENLLAWISTVRHQCQKLSRPDVADICIGDLLSSSPIGEDGIWPNEVVRDVLEELHSEKIMSGARTGLYNSRGVHTRGRGGAQERELADKYRKWADALEHTHPFLHSKLLMEMVRGYEFDADREDLEVDIQLRMQ
jgi:addiction module HigA family antidote